MPVTWVNKQLVPVMTAQATTALVSGSVEKQVEQRQTHHGIYDASPKKRNSEKRVLIAHEQGTSITEDDLLARPAAALACLERTQILCLDETTTADLIWEGRPKDGSEDFYQTQTQTNSVPYISPTSSLFNNNEMIINVIDNNVNDMLEDRSERTERLICKSICGNDQIQTLELSNNNVNMACTSFVVKNLYHWSGKCVPSKNFSFIDGSKVVVAFSNYDGSVPFERTFESLSDGRHEVASPAITRNFDHYHKHATLTYPLDPVATMQELTDVA